MYIDGCKGNVEKGKVMKKYSIGSIFVLCACTMVSTSVIAQDAPPLQNLRFEEDWSGFDPSESSHFLAPLKKIEISDSVWLSIGGEQRVRYEQWRNFGFGGMNDDSFTLFRTHLHADLHFGDGWRIFVEGRMNTLNNRDLPGGKRAALDIDEGSFQNTFVEKKLQLASKDVTVRLGRQELQFGKQRLVSPLDWANNRRIFDGVSVRVQGNGPWKLDVFVTQPVTVDPNELTFNNTNDDILFSGIYYTRALGESGTSIDAYALAKNHVDDAPVEEDRYTVGGRYFGTITGNWTFDSEAAIQFGEREVMLEGGGSEVLDIFAYMLTVEVTYTWKDCEYKPWITAGVDYASGDNDADDGDVNTFDQLFPLAHAFLGFSDVVGRQNVIDVRGTAGFWPMPGKLRAKADIHFLRLADDNDGLYGAGGTLSRPAAGEDDLGTAIDLTLFYKFSQHMNVLVGYSYFNAGDFIEDTGPDKNINFFYTQWGYTF